MTDFRALCEELVDALKDENTYTIRIELIDRARAALAEQPVRPTDEEIRTLAAFDADFDCFETTDESGNVGNAWECSDSQLLDFARAVLARWGAPAATPLANGEVERLQWIADEFAQGSELKGSGYASDIQAVIKHILHPRPAAVPIPASERLPCLEDCDEQGRCWFHSTGRAWCDWYLLTASSATDTETHWLPANALPTPETP